MTLQIIRKGDPSRAVLEERAFKGGRITIGRGDNSVWRLADEGRVLSKIHCEIFNRGDEIYLIDCSSNGVFLNGSRMRMMKDQAVLIREGDRFALGEYEIVAQAWRAARSVADSSGEMSRSGPLDKVDIVGDWLGESDPAAAVLGRPVKPSVSDLIDGIAGAPRDPFADVGRDVIPEAPRGRGELSNAFLPPLLAEQRATTASGAIPDDWDQLLSSGDIGRSAQIEPRVAPPPPRAEPLSKLPPPPAAPSILDGAGGEEALAAFLGGAGLDPAAFAGAPAAEVLRRAGAVYRQAVLNYSDILRDRSFLKNEFRIERTIVGAQGNNPLKFLTAQQAAVSILLAPGDGFIDGAAAVREAGEDIKKHQIAVMSGLRMALQALLDRFRPETLLGAGPAKKSGLRLPGSEQADIGRAWDRFKLLHATCEDDAARRTDNFLNNAFRRGYEVQLECLEGADVFDASQK